MIHILLNALIQNVFYEVQYYKYYFCSLQLHVTTFWCVFFGGGECNIHSFHRWKMNWEGRVLNNERARGYKLNAQVKAPLFFHELK